METFKLFFLVGIACGAISSGVNGMSTIASINSPTIQSKAIESVVLADSDDDIESDDSLDQACVQKYIDIGNDETEIVEICE